MPLTGEEIRDTAHSVARTRARRLWAAHLRQSYRIDWVRGEPRQLLTAFAKWDDAVQCAAETGDAGSLIDLFRSDEPLHRDARNLLGELLLGRQIARRPGGQATPGRISVAQGTLHRQAALYRYWRGRGQSHDEVLLEFLNSLQTVTVPLSALEPV